MLQRKVPQPDWYGIEYPGMDELALHRGHRYATVIVEPSRRQVPRVGPGRGREVIRPFFEALNEPARRRIRAVVLDRNTAFDLEVQAHCPNTKLVYDPPQAAAKYGRELIDRVRVDEADRPRGAGPGPTRPSNPPTSCRYAAGRTRGNGPTRGPTWMNCRRPTKP